MGLEEIFKDKSLKPKERTAQLSKLVSEHVISLDELIQFAAKAKDPVKATCIESLEFASKADPGIITDAALAFVLDSLGSKAPRVKWECARVIGNCIHLFPANIDIAAGKLLVNTEDEGTVVRWSAAFALSQVLLLKSGINEQLIPAVETIMDREEKNSIKKIYAAALKKLKPAKK